MAEKIDNLTPRGAQALAAQIEAYWRREGAAVRYEVVLLPIGHGSVAGIRSNLVGGLPRRTP